MRPKMPVSERKFDWPMIYKYALLKDNVLPFEIILAMGSMSGLFGFLIWYLEMVLPWTATIPEPLHFPFKVCVESCLIACCWLEPLVLLSLTIFFACFRTFFTAPSLDSQSL